MNEIFDIIEQMRTHFGWDQTDTIEFVQKCILEEAQELNQTSDPQEMAKELADVLMYSFTLTKLMGLDMTDIIRNKANEVMQRDYDK